MRHNRKPLTISGFADAAAAAFGLRHRFRRAHVAAMLNRDGQVLDLTLFTRTSHSIGDALGWAGCLMANNARVARIVLLSAVTESTATEVREDDIATLRRARRSFTGAGVLVVDWLQCDGQGVRSIDLATDGEGWRLASSVA